MSRCLLCLLTLVALFLPQIVRAELVELTITEKTPWKEGKSFGEVGPYERWKGRATFAVDPTLEANKAVVDVELAPRNDKGLVEFSADVEMLVPKDLAKARGTLLYDVNNRGRDRALKMFNGGADEFLMRHGFIVVWSGWLCDVLPNQIPYDPAEEIQMSLLLDAPIVTNHGDPITGVITGDFVVNEPTERANITNRPYLACYEPTGDERRSLTWQLRADDQPIAIPNDQWHLATTWELNGKKLKLPKVELVMPAGLKPGYIYRLGYEAKNPVVQGLGMAGIRDLVSFLRHDASERNPLVVDGRNVVERTIGDGNSQSGRCLRVFTYHGFNADEQDRQVFDGIMPVVTGAGLGLHERFVQPSRFASQHLDHHFPTDVFPFTYGPERDLFEDRTEGLLDRARAKKVVPKIMHVQTSCEYWCRSGVYVHVKPDGCRDSEIPDEVRIYSIAGAQHAAGDDLTIVKGLGQLPENPTDYRPPLRALLLALERWITDGTEPPASVYPRNDNGTLVHWGPQTETWKLLPGVRYPEVMQIPEAILRPVTGPSSVKALVGLPPETCCFPMLTYGPDNNERGMLNLPPIAVPVATYTGWSLRRADVGAENELIELKGSYIPFARTKAEREKLGDLRSSLEELYPTFDDYVAKTEAAAKKLVEEGYLLEEDVARYVERAQKRRAMFEAQ